MVVERIDVHCWEDGPEEADGMSTTCMLPLGHRGPHRWTRDDKIRIKFKPPEPGSEPRV